LPDLREHICRRHRDRHANRILQNRAKLSLKGSTISGGPVMKPLHDLVGRVLYRKCDGHSIPPSPPA
jgi:hypothetical protein